MEHLTPLWLLKYLPNMLACHVTIIHDAQGPSNTITCAEASGALSLGESLRVIQRGAAEACFCGGAESKLNPMAYIRQEFTGRLVDTSGLGDGAGPRPSSPSTGGRGVACSARAAVSSSSKRWTHSKPAAARPTPRSSVSGPRSPSTGRVSASARRRGTGGGQRDPGRAAVGRA